MKYVSIIVDGMVTQLQYRIIVYSTVHNYSHDVVVVADQHGPDL